MYFASADASSHASFLLREMASRYSTFDHSRSVAIFCSAVKSPDPSLPRIQNHDSTRTATAHRPRVAVNILLKCDINLSKLKDESMIEAPRSSRNLSMLEVREVMPYLFDGRARRVGRHGQIFIIGWRFDAKTGRRLQNNSETRCLALAGRLK